MTTIAILTDAHLPRGSGTMQHACFAWAMAALQRLQPDLVVAAGDMTAIGDVDAARTVQRGLASIGVPYLSTPGNTDVRTPDTIPEVMSLLLTDPVLEHENVLLLCCNSMHGTITDDERVAAERIADTADDRALVVISHVYPRALDPDSESWLRGFVERQDVSLLISGHGHRDKTETIGTTPVHQLRGLDPEKATRAPPAIFLFTHNAGTWTLDEIPFTDSTVDDWNDADRTEFLDNLGISTMAADETLSSIEWATTENVPCLELRADCLNLPLDRLQSAIARWRDGGGRCLSWHMADVTWDPGTRSLCELDTWRRGLDRAQTIGAEHLNLHPPRIPASAMAPGNRAWADIAAIMTEALAPVAGTGITIAVENLHKYTHETVDDRNFGYLPDEMGGWIDELRSRLPHNPVGFQLDIGHARTNCEFNHQCGIGQWCAQLGHELVGYHIHQVREQDHGLQGHLPIDHVFGPNISLAGFFWAWKARQINHCPMFIETRGQEARHRSWHVVRDHVRGLITPIHTRC